MTLRLAQHLLLASYVLGHALGCFHIIGDNKLNCTSRGLTEVPRNRYNDVITVLILTGNHLEILDNDNFIQYPYLTTLCLKMNDIKVVQKHAFHGLSQLIVLDLSKNRIVSIFETTFHSNLRLETLNLSNNPLQIANPNKPFIVSKSIHTLIVSETKLTEINDIFLSGINNLDTLDISFNLLTTVDLDFTKSLQKLNQIYLHGNPWRCGGAMEELVQSKQHLIADRKKMHCVTSDGEQQVWSQGSWKPATTSSETSNKQTSHSVVVKSTTAAPHVDITGTSSSVVPKTTAGARDNKAGESTSAASHTDYRTSEEDMYEDDDMETTSNESTKEDHGEDVSSNFIIYINIAMVSAVLLAAVIVVILMRRPIWSCLTQKRSDYYQSNIKNNAKVKVHRDGHNAERLSCFEPIYESINELSSI